MNFDFAQAVNRLHSLKLAVLYAFGRSSLYWLVDWIENIEFDETDADSCAWPSLSPADVTELYIYMQTMLQTFDALRQASDDLQATDAPVADSRSADESTGDMAFKYGALVNLNVVASLAAEGSDEDSLATDAQKLALTSAFLGEVLYQVGDYIALFLGDEVRMPATDTKVLVACVQVVIDMLAGLNDLAWPAGTPVPPALLVDLYRLRVDRRLCHCDWDSAENLIGKPLRALEDLLIAKVEEPTEDKSDEVAFS